MLLYFTNNSKQKKILAETDYIEDVYDEIVAFFTDYKIMPHFINVQVDDGFCRIGWESQSEYFVCEDTSREDAENLRNMFDDDIN